MNDNDTANTYRRDWMSDDQWFCYQLLATAYCGYHHAPRRPKPWGTGIEVNTSAHRLATFDFNLLTRLVFLAHDRLVRIELGSSGPRLIKIILHRRHSRTGQMSERHPTIEAALADHREYEPLEHHPGEPADPDQARDLPNPADGIRAADDLERAMHQPLPDPKMIARYPIDLATVAWRDHKLEDLTSETITRALEDPELTEVTWSRNPAQLIADLAAIARSRSAAGIVLDPEIVSAAVAYCDAASATADLAGAALEDLGGVGECAWRSTDDFNDVIWSTGCGESWVFTEGEPKDHNVRFCFGCGERVKIDIFAD